MYDLPELHRQMLDVLGIDDAQKIIPLSEERKPRDPVSENMDVLNGKPLKAFIHQDHDAHIQIHQAAVQDPKVQALVGESPMASTIASSMAAHIQEHLAFKYRAEIEKELGVELPPPDEPLPNEVEVRLSKLVAEAAERLLNKDISETQQQENQQKMEDPVIQMQQKKLELQQQDIQRKADTDKARLAANMAQAEMRQETEQYRIDQQSELEGVRLGVDIAKSKAELADKKEELEAKNLIEKAKIVSQAGKALMDDEQKDNKN